MMRFLSRFARGHAQCTLLLYSLCSPLTSLQGSHRTLQSERRSSFYVTFRLHHRVTAYLTHHYKRIPISVFETTSILSPHLSHTLRDAAHQIPCEIHTALTLQRAIPVRHLRYTTVHTPLQRCGRDEVRTFQPALHLPNSLSCEQDPYVALVSHLFLLRSFLSYLKVVRSI